jgi:thiamine-phosphate pyrophosphorylase
VTLDEARLYLVAPARIQAGDLVSMVGELVGAGVDLIQLREKDMEAGDLLRVGEPLVGACRDAGVAFIVNDRPDVALALGADGVHLGQNDLPVAAARRVVGDGIVGRSSHSETEVDSEVAGGADYIAVGPVHPTPTKQGRPGTGLGLISHAAGVAGDLPWFAIGGIEEANLSDVLEAGARRIVVVRAITEATDPPAAAARLRALLDAAPA